MARGGLHFTQLRGPLEGSGGGRGRGGRERRRRGGAGLLSCGGEEAGSSRRDGLVGYGADGGKGEVGLGMSVCVLPLALFFT